MAVFGSAPVQQKAFTAWSSGTTITCTMDATPTNGNGLVILFEESSTSAANVSSITQTGATWVNELAYHTGRTVEVWRAYNVSSASASITINLAGNPGASSVIGATVQEWLMPSGVAVDVAQGANATQTNADTASITPTASREALIVAVYRAGGAVSAGPTGSFTAGTSMDASVRGFCAYQVVASTSGSYQCGWTQSSSNYAAGIVCFVAPGTGSLFRPYYMNNG